VVFSYERETYITCNIIYYKMVTKIKMF